MFTGCYAFSERERFSKLVSHRGVSLVSKQARLEGFQTFIIEQWVTDRTRFNNTVMVYTGDKSDVVIATVLEFSQELELESQGALLHIYEDLQFENAKATKTENGWVMVTNLNTFPSTLNLLQVPGGDYEGCVEKLYLNINLKRCRCSGRSGLSLKDPSEAQIEKLRYLFCLPEHRDYSKTIINMVKACQEALRFFDMFPFEVDGLICDETLGALQQYHEIFKIEDIHDKQDLWFNPSILAAILSNVLKVKSMLQILNHQPPKDPFLEPELFVQAISTYEKAHQLPNSQIIDKSLLYHLTESCRKTSSQSTRVRKAIMSKIEDLSGHNPQIYQETSDLAHLVRNLHCDSLRAIWKGKKLTDESVQFKESTMKWIESGLKLIKSENKETTKPGKEVESLPESTGRLKYTSSIKGIRDIAGSKISNTMGLIEQKLTRSHISRLRKLAPESNLLEEIEKTELGMDSPNQLDWIDNQLLPLEDISKLKGLRHDPSMRFRSYSDSALNSRLKVFHSPLRRSKSLLLADSDKNSKKQMELRSVDPKAYILLDDLTRKEDILRKKLTDSKRIVEAFGEDVNLLSRLYVLKYNHVSETQQKATAFFNEQQKVADFIEAVETSESKLRYELRVLNEKLCEVEELLHNFHYKVKDFENQIQISKRGGWVMTKLYGFFHPWIDKILQFTSSQHVNNK